MWLKCNAFFVITILTAGNVGASTGTPSGLYAALTKAISDEKDAARAWEEWEKERAALEQKIVKLKMEIAYLQHEKEKYENYRDTARTRSEKLEQQRESAQELISNLERFLYDATDRLDEAIRNDLPFHREQRLKRLTDLKATLADYSISLSEKTRKVLETLLAEALYGRSVEVYDGMLKEGDKEQYVQFLRVGRLALFCGPPDRSFLNFYDPVSHTWKPVSGDLRDRVLEVFDRVQRGDSLEPSREDTWLVIPVAGERAER
ncbi:DUF3450 domain-containing protein [Thermodesulforhabdus norvegica]|uniref:DUF3450 domain-containing protein n=1 Tax=Thermodesulforhabdus norvegica TaxID=39841 RepID=A0A1I4QX63_9BACT|nr:DUF3450 domain-containing protein [Thermodesulforhabdus norvegica]SFM44601.1 Protein of unknown function [Thermodesulforhabdus norvegica]